MNILQGYLHSHVPASLFTIAKTWKQPKRLWMDAWVDSLITHTHGTILFLHRKVSPSICDHMDKPGGHYPKLNKTNISYGFTHMQNLKGELRS